jgi:hypothetical protein
MIGLLVGLRFFHFALLLRVIKVAIASGRRLADRLFGGEPRARLEYSDIATGENMNSKSIRENRNIVIA